MSLVRVTETTAHHRPGSERRFDCVQLESRQIGTLGRRKPTFGQDSLSYGVTPWPGVAQGGQRVHHLEFEDPFRSSSAVEQAAVKDPGADNVVSPWEFDWRSSCGHLAFF